MSNENNIRTITKDGLKYTMGEFIISLNDENLKTQDYINQLDNNRDPIPGEIESFYRKVEKNTDLIMFKKQDMKYFFLLTIAKYSAYPLSYNDMNIIESFKISGREKFDQWCNETLISNQWEICPVIESGQSEKYCICTQKISSYHYIVNKINGNILRVGGLCIKKFNDENYQQFKAMLSTCSRCKEHFNKNQGKKLSHQIYCPTCFIQAEDVPIENFVSICQICNSTIRKNIYDKDTDTTWKTKCKDCYKKEMNKKSNSKSDGQDIIPGNGKYAGSTFEHVHSTDKSYVMWVTKLPAADLKGWVKKFRDYCDNETKSSQQQGLQFF